MLPETSSSILVPLKIQDTESVLETEAKIRSTVVYFLIISIAARLL